MSSKAIAVLADGTPNNLLLLQVAAAESLVIRERLRGKLGLKWERGLCPAQIQLYKENAEKKTVNNVCFQVKIVSN